MANIKVNNIKLADAELFDDLAGAELFDDSESFINELEDEELEVRGGIVAAVCNCCRLWSILN